MSLPNHEALARIARQRAERRGTPLEPAAVRMDWAAEDGRCVYLGEESEVAPCGCAGQGLTSVFNCLQADGEKCVPLRSQRIKVAARNSHLQNLRACENCPLKVTQGQRDTAVLSSTEVDLPGEPKPAQ